MSIIFHENNIDSSLIHFYSLKGDYETYLNIKNSLLPQDFKNLVFQADSYGYFPLFYAFIGGNRSIIEDLLSNDNLFLTLKDFHNNIEWTHNQHIINISLNSKNIDIFHFVLDNVSLSNINIYNVIHEILTLNDKLRSILSYDYFINLLKENEEPFLIDPFQQNIKGESLIYFSIYNDNEYIFEKLYQFMDFSKYKDNNPFSFIIFDLSFFTINEKIKFKFNRMKYFHHLIERYGINFINKPFNNNISLGILAIENFDEDILSVLVSNNVNPIDKDVKGNTFLHTCVNKGSIHSYNILKSFFSYSSLVIKNNDEKTVYDMANLYFKDVLEYEFGKIKKEKPATIEKKESKDVKQIE